MDNIATFENPIMDDTADIVDADDVEANLRTTGEKSAAVSSGRNAGGKKQPGASARSGAAKQKKPQLAELKEDKGIIPESAFSVTTFEGSTTARKKAEFAAQMRAQYEAGFMRIQGSIMEAGSAGLWRMCWAETTNRQFAMRDDVEKELGWSETMASNVLKAIQLEVLDGREEAMGLRHDRQVKNRQADKTSIKLQTNRGRTEVLGAIEKQIKERKAALQDVISQESNDGQNEDDVTMDARKLAKYDFAANDDEDVMVTVATAVYRMFVKTRKADGAITLAMGGDPVAEARKFAKVYSSLEADDIMGDEFISLDDATQAVRLAIAKEKRVREERLKSLKKRQKRADSAPTALVVSGLTGDSEAANGRLVSISFALCLLFCSFVRLSFLSPHFHYSSSFFSQPHIR